MDAHRSMSGRSTIANWKNTPIRLQFFSMAPHNGAEKFKTIRRDGENYGNLGATKRGREADIGVADGLLTAFKRAIKKNDLPYLPALSGRKFGPCRAVFFLFFFSFPSSSINARMLLISTPRRGH